jgi:subtilisin family serine protease
MKKYWNKLSLGALTLAVASVGFLASCQKEQVAIEKPAVSTAPDDEFIVDTKSVPIPGQYIVIFKDQATSRSSMTAAERKNAVRSTIASVLSKTGQRAEIDDSKIFSNTVQGFVAKIDAATADKLRKDERVAYVEQDKLVTLGRRGWSKATWNVAQDPQTPSTQKVPWGIRKVGGAGNGTGKVAWIIDSGIDLLHPDLNVDASRSLSFLNSSNQGNWQSPNDESGHGTHVAGIIAAKNNSFGVVGVAAGATVISLRVFDASNSGDASLVIEALDYVAEHGKAGDVINLSLGSDVFQSLDDAVRRTAAKGIFISIAAGNESKDCANTSPARVNAPNVFTISAVDSLSRMASFSNYGEPVDYAAPGKQILSTYKGGKYAWLSGTSMAAPHVAGILLLNGGKVNSSATITGDPDGNADKLAKR